MRSGQAAGTVFQAAAAARRIRGLHRAQLHGPLQQAPPANTTQQLFFPTHASRPAYMSWRTRGGAAAGVGTCKRA